MNRARRLPGFLALAFALTCATARATEHEVQIIVNAENSVERLSTERIADFFLKRKRQWPDGTSVRFIDRMDDSPERATFLRDMIRKTAREVDLFWIGQKLYTGDVAPMQVATDAMTASLVSRFKGAIGYVSAAFAASRGVKKIEVEP